MHIYKHIHTKLEKKGKKTMKNVRIVKLGRNGLVLWRNKHALHCPGGCTDLHHWQELPLLEE